MTPPPGLPQLPAEIETLIRSRCCSCAGCANKLHGPGHYGTDDSCKADVILDMLAARERRVREEALAMVVSELDIGRWAQIKPDGTSSITEQRDTFANGYAFAEGLVLDLCDSLLPSSPERQG